MKKLVLAVLALLFLSTGLAMASDFSVTGSYFVRGRYVKNSDYGQLADNAPSYGYYDHEMVVDSTWKISDQTKVFARFDMRDEAWGGGNTAYPLTSSNIADDGTFTGQADDNVYLQQVWGSHTFCNGHTLTVGLMGAGAWGTKFADNANEAYRIKYAAPTPVGTFVGIIEKPYDAIAKDNDNDTDVYHLGFITKAGNVYIKPLLSYAKVANLGIDKYVFHLAANGDFNNGGFESELRYEKFDTTTVDYDNWGIYANVWSNIGAAKVGLIGAYGSYDDTVQKGLEFGEDFDELGFVIMGESAFFGEINTAKTTALGTNVYDFTASNLRDTTGLVGARLGALYANVQATDRLSLQSLIGYAKSNMSRVPKWDGASMYELNLTGAYKVSDNVTYSFGAAYAQAKYGDDATPDPDNCYELYHKLTFSF